MTRGFLILHGLSSRRPPEHWHHRLAVALGERGELVRYPQLPDPDEPSRGAWEEVAVAELEALVAEGTTPIVVCHSLGCTTWLGLGPILPPRLHAARTLLVAPPAPDVLADLAPGFVELPSRDGALAAGGETTLVVSESDPYNPPGAEGWRWLGTSIELVPGAGHFTVDDGYGEWPAVLEWCRSGVARFDRT